MGTGCSKDNENDRIGTLFRAIRRERFQLAADLISKGTGVDCINYFGSTPLIETCKHHRRTRKRSIVECDRESFVRFLIDNYCDVSKYDIYGWTALMYAEKNSHYNIADILEKNEGKNGKRYVYSDESE
ncbi:Hypothetical predicted protein [Mytilus galloprovincialis]|uniref:Uncharacterized protein n=1 Tax=Mytilus galloprovincialis TaxID=29158 RepID=A0A8B6DZ77_MYTGA|nr:Hypothetical predicted protein [Mytilus galloprovincialis]VDI44887.1 Hypothetical predicted protein [Mytilus galloprovincialis]